MIKLAGLSGEQVTEISRRIADAFFDYEYNKEDIGLIKYISTRDDMFTYMNAIVRAAYKSGSQKWYEVEITTEQAAGSTQDPVYADSDDSTDNDLEAANDEAEKSILNAGDDDDDGEDDSSDDEDDEESDDDNELITLTGYVNADQISVVITAVE